MSVSILLAAAAIGQPQPGELATELPTLHCLGFRWFVGGAKADEAKVKVEYRRRGGAGWKPAMDLFRVETAAMKSKPPEGQVLHAGSVFGLQPGTEYEVTLTLVHGSKVVARRKLVQRTWSEPVAFSRGTTTPRRVLHVVPGEGGGSGTERTPFRGLAAADASAKPGDLVLVHPGVYRGPVTFSKSGRPDAPIVWRGKGGGEAIIQGSGQGRVVAAGRLEHVFFEDLSVRGARWGMVLHGSKNLVIRRCRFEDVGTGITGDAREERILVSDCVFQGRQTWPGKASSEDRAIELSGSAHVICYNRIHHFKDGIDTRPALPVTGVDIHNNDISQCLDDGVELDFSEHNCRAYENRLTDVQLGISFQPVYGGPAYAVRNVLYNVVHESFKLHITPPNTEQDTSGGVLLHNTVVKKDVPFRVWSNEGPARYFFSRNNLLVGGESRYAIEITCPMEYCDFDFDVFGGPFRTFANWNKRRYASLRQFASGTALERHGLVVGKVGGLFGGGLLPPEDTGIEHDVPAGAFVLASRSPAVDRGARLPSVNDDFTGAAPDAGAYEQGRPSPHYGPRPGRPRSPVVRTARPEPGVKDARERRPPEHGRAGDGKAAREPSPTKEAERPRDRASRPPRVGAGARLEESEEPQVSAAEQERLRRYKEAETAFIEGDLERAAGLFRAIVEDYPGSDEAGKAKEYLDMLQ